MELTHRIRKGHHANLKRGLTLATLLVSTAVLMLASGCAVVNEVVEEVDETIDEDVGTGGDTFCDSYPTEEERAECRRQFESATGSVLETPESATSIPPEQPGLTVEPPRVSPQGMIAFVSDPSLRSGGERSTNDIYLINADGTGLRNLTNHPAEDGWPDWSPNAELIVFASDRDNSSAYYDLYVMNADGSGVGRLTQDLVATSPRWSPDGTQIAFVSKAEAGEPDIYLINADGTGLRNLTFSSISEQAPSWSPDGQRIVFYSVLRLAVEDDLHVNLYVMNADGSGVEQLTYDPPHCFDPSWSPDGSLIAFTSGPDLDTNWTQICLMSPDGSGLSPLTNGPHDYAPCWSPDGLHIAFQSTFVSGDSSDQPDIFVANADGSEVRNLTNDAAPECCPSWSPR